ncbi:MAG: hypothetical protein H6613_12500 [Ignavibacteriales bacterium]|nr:hypothetical protein [Ignavibacteriales bacterium]
MEEFSEEFEYEIISILDDSKEIDYIKKEGRELEELFIEELQPFGEKRLQQERSFK